MATTWHIAAAGNDSTGTGSIGSPYATFTKALTVALTGDTIAGNGGDSITDAPVFSTSTVLGLTFTSYGTGRCTITGGASSAFTYGSNAGAANTTLSNLIFTSTATTLSVIGISQANSSRQVGLTITLCDISGGGYGISMTAFDSSTGGINSVTFSNNNIHTCTIWGIVVQASDNTHKHFSNLQMLNNTVSGITGTATDDGSGSGINFSGCDSVTGSGAAQCVCSGNLIATCGIDNNTSSGAGPVGLQIIYSDSVLITGNVINTIQWGTVGNDAEGILIDDNSTNTTITYNYIYSCYGPGIALNPSTGAGSVIAFNVLLLNATQGGTGYGNLALFTGAAAQVYNNTVVTASASPSMRIETGATVNKKIANNIFKNTTSGNSLATIDASLDATCVLQGNAYESGSSSFLCNIGGTSCASLGALRTATGQETSPHGFGPPVDFLVGGSPPVLTPSQLGTLSAYQLGPGSPLINAGLDINSLYSINPGTRDFLGVPLVVPYCVGAINATSGGISYHGSSVNLPRALPLSQLAVTAKYF